MKRVKKLFGERPETVNVLDVAVDFDEAGEAHVEAEIADVFAQIPGYEVDGEEIAEDPSEDTEEGEDEADPAEGQTEEPSEGEEEAPAIKKPARKSPARKK